MNKIEYKEGEIKELWVVTKNGQHRIQNQSPKDEISLSFWIEDKPIEVFQTTYENLLEALKLVRYGNKNLWTNLNPNQLNTIG